jgi:hypothetical protein
MHSACAVTLPPPSAPQKQRWTSCAGPGAAATLSFKLWNEAQEVHGRLTRPFFTPLLFTLLESSAVHLDHGEVPTFKLAASSDTTLPFLPFQVRSHPRLLSQSLSQTACFKLLAVSGSQGLPTSP